MQHPNKKITNYKRLPQLYNSGAIFTAIDTETSTNSVSTGRIIELSAVRFSKDGILSSYTTLCNPNQQLSQFITDLTHITQNMVDAAPFIQEKLSDFLDFIGDTILIGHNVQYDMNFINYELNLCNKRPTKNKIIDTLHYSIISYPELEKHNLEFLADKFKINKGSSHRALDDAHTCMHLFLQMLKDSQN